MSRATVLRTWWAEQGDTAGDPVAVADAFDVAVRDRLLPTAGRDGSTLPLPGSGATIARWRELAWWGGTDLSLARLVEGHTDAVAILAELGAPPLPEQMTSAVWAAEPPGSGLTAVRGAHGWTVDGAKAWCSGASVCRTALVTATAEDGQRLFLVRLDAPGIDRPRGPWVGAGMRASDTGTVCFDAVAAEPIGPVDGYLARSGFWVGGIGVAAVWFGGAMATARPLRAAASVGRAGPHALAHLGRVRVLLDACSALLERAARVVDAAPTADHEALAVAVRSAVADAATEIIDRVGRAVGPGPLATDAEHAQRVADLTVFVRQSHAERDLARLGELDAADHRDDASW